MKAQVDISAASLENMSLFQFISRIDRRGKSLHLRTKSTIVKEKPFLRLDARRKEAGAMARLCLRLHRPFRTEAADPMHLEDGTAVAELHAFVRIPTCPVWLKKRYAKHNRVKAAKQATEALSSVNITAATENQCLARCGVATRRARLPSCNGSNCARGRCVPVAVYRRSRGRCGVSTRRTRFAKRYVSSSVTS